MVTCWETADLLVFVFDDYLCFVTFPGGILGRVWYLIISIPDLCRLFYFLTLHKFKYTEQQKKRINEYCVFRSLKII